MSTIRICCSVWTFFSTLVLLDRDTENTRVPYPQQLHIVLTVLEGGLWLELCGLWVLGSWQGHRFPACAWLNHQASVSQIFFLKYFSTSSCKIDTWYLQITYTCSFISCIAKQGKCCLFPLEPCEAQVINIHKMLWKSHIETCGDQ